PWPHARCSNAVDDIIIVTTLEYFMALHFPRETFFERIRAARQRLQQEQLDALLVFAQESHYYLTGFDTSRYVFFQCTIITADDHVSTAPRPGVNGGNKTSWTPYWSLLRKVITT